MQLIRIFFEKSGDPRVTPLIARARLLESIVWVVESYNNAEVRDVTISFLDPSATMVTDPGSGLDQTYATVGLLGRRQDPSDPNTTIGEGVLVGRVPKSIAEGEYKYDITSTDGFGTDGPKLDPKIIIEEP